MINLPNDLPLWLRDELRDTNYPEYINDYVIDTYKSNNLIFENQYKKALENSKRKGFGNSSKNLWIASNTTFCLNKGYSYNTCYYCGIELNINNLSQTRMEHCHLKLHEPGNIVSSCVLCDKMKKDYTTDRFIEFFKNKDLNKSAEPTKIEFRLFVYLPTPC